MTEPRTPLWQLTRTYRQGFWLSGLFALVAVLSWLLAVPAGGTVELVLAIVWTVIALALTASAVALRRRDRD